MSYRNLLHNLKLSKTLINIDKRSDNSRYEYDSVFYVNSLSMCIHQES